MLKQIETRELRLGMYLQELTASWLENPFWRTSRLLNNQQEINDILASNIKFAIIDISKGIDVPNRLNHTVQPEVVAKPEAIIDPPASIKVQAAVPIEAEFQRAAQICARSKSAVMSMFSEIRMGKAIRLENAASLVEDISESVNRNVSALITLARLKNQDDYTYMHSVAVCALMIALAKQLGLTEEQIKEAGTAGLLHDIGKMSVDSSILNKPGKLTDLEFEIVRRHPEEGHQYLLQAGGIGKAALDVCLHHHERVDGTGYPYRLKGEELSLYAKMGAICDVYDAITSNRPYKAGWCPADSIKKMASWSGTHFDADVFKAFVKTVGIYPVGTLVRLTSGRLGVVVDQGARSLLAPRLRVFFSTKSNTYLPPVMIDLSAPGERDKVVCFEDADQWKIKDLERFWRC
ncbi:HD-GYP domain-containing protein|uniref:HD-GYP domain-containing protein n=1 Tax=Noviherbaspirillum sp. L7-7A TaxID=2850560 RepID=UPI001C2C7471|nr:HD-GYP domain-containing protein [Noviherbaspirillum sp. L7-7A]MBV0877691.1 HD-GYP domain-containing protein [Noviherbaspirillum sp. L7-7A]